MHQSSILQKKTPNVDVRNDETFGIKHLTASKAYSSFHPRIRFSYSHTIFHVSSKFVFFVVHDLCFYLLSRTIFAPFENFDNDFRKILLSKDKMQGTGSCIQFNFIWNTCSAILNSTPGPLNLCEDHFYETSLAYILQYQFRRRIEPLHAMCACLLITLIRSTYVSS